MKTQKIWILLLLLFLTFCKSPPNQHKQDTEFLGTTSFAAPLSQNPMASGVPVYTPLPRPMIKDAQGNEQFTFQGNNRQPHFSENDKEIFYISSQRTHHRQFQIYSYHLQNLLEKRWTYNDGINLDPQMGLEGHLIFYSSTTDEQKDFPKKIYPELYKNNKIEIPWDFETPLFYLNSEIHSFSVTEKDTSPDRFTKRLGFDGFPRFSTDQILYYVEKTDLNFALKKIDPKTHRSHLIFNAKSDPIWKPQYDSKLKLWVWISWKSQNENPTQHQQIYLWGAQTPKAMTLSTPQPQPQPPPTPRGEAQAQLQRLSLPAGQYHDAIWVEGKNILLMSARINNDKDFNIYEYNISQNCLKIISQNLGDEVDLALNHQQTELLFAMRTEMGTEASFQLYKKAYLPISASCITLGSSL